MLRSVTLAAIVLGVAAGEAAAQQVGAPRHAGVVVPIGLPRPIYPQIAQAARVMGEVEVRLVVRPDGTVEDAAASGPPMLQQAAIDAARRASLECRDCEQGSASYVVIYAFELREHVPAEPDVPSVVVTSASARVPIIGALTVLIDPASPTVRGLRCLYLWRCRVTRDPRQ